MNQNQGTRPLHTSQRTAPLGDAFISSNGPIQSVRTTRPLRMSSEMLREALPNRIAEIQSELDYVEHLVNLFRPRINIFRYAETLITLPDDAIDPNEHEVETSPVAEEQEEVAQEESPVEGVEAQEELPAEDGFPEETPPPLPKLTFKERTLAAFRLSPEKQEYATKVSERIQNNPKLRQRVQITIHQFSDAESTYAKARGIFMGLLHNLPENAWEILDGIGIERLKGKAYAICGFYDNFKDDPLLGTVFPAPHQNPTMPVQQVQQPQAAPPPQKPASFLDNLKGLFGKKA